MKKISVCKTAIAVLALASALCAPAGAALPRTYKEF